MSDIGPDWLREELPQPIANAWHLALEGSPVDGNAAVAAVEVALRFVTALQMASLLAGGGTLPDIVTNPKRRGKWTLGSWVALVCDLRDALEEPFVPELATWPEPAAEALLSQFTDIRNLKLVHAGQKTAYVRREVEERVATQAARVLETLSWLKAVTLICFSEARGEADGAFSGRALVFRSWDDQPASGRITWRGPVEVGHLYLEASAPTSTALLDVEPFLRRARIGGAHTEAICLWNGIGNRHGEVRLVDDIQEQSLFVPLPQHVAMLPFERVPNRYPSTDAAMQVAGDAELARPALPMSRPTRRLGKKTWWPWLGLGGLLVAGGAAVALGMSPSDPCAAPEIAGTWRFDTEVRHTKAGRESARGVRGHYSVTFEPTAADCTVPATIIKTGFTEAGRASQGQLSDRVTFAPSPTGWSAAANAHIAGGSGVVDIAFRVAREGDALVGLWRYEGESWQRAGFAGGLVGDAHTGRGTASGEVGFVDACFHDCVERCRDAEAPLAVESEDCLRRCAPRLHDCPG